MQRTDKQNRSLYKWFDQVADCLNDAGLDMKVVLKPEVEIPWTKESVKNHLWRPIQILMMDKESTAEMETVDPDKVARVISRHLASNLGIELPPWPSNENRHD
jgi:hypothetical protein